MEVRNCRKCRRLFNYLGGQNICPECRDALERSFLQVKDHIRDNPNNTLQEISESCEVEVQQIRDWIRDGRLEISKGSPIELNCEKCGAKILKGRFCDSCNQKLADNLSALVAADTKARMPVSDDGSKGPKMRFKK